jgi:hypothetical protein
MRPLPASKQEASGGSSANWLSLSKAFTLASVSVAYLIYWSIANRDRFKKITHLFAKKKKKNGSEGNAFKKY